MKLPLLSTTGLSYRTFYSEDRNKKLIQSLSAHVDRWIGRCSDSDPRAFRALVLSGDLFRDSLGNYRQPLISWGISWPLSTWIRRMDPNADHEDDFI